MKQKIIIFLMAIVTVMSCEKDNICIESTTPYLVIRFKDFESQDDFKTISLDSVWAEGKDDNYLESESTDSLAIPLDLNNDFTKYYFAKNNSSEASLVDEINFAYVRKDTFVGRACGYKTVFYDFQISENTTEWIKEIEVINTIIEYDTTSAITIYH